MTIWEYHHFFGGKYWGLNSGLSSKHSTTWDMPPELIALVCLDIVSCFCQGWAQTMGYNPPTYASWVAGKACAIMLASITY
jgi:hypothetical protein